MFKLTVAALVFLAASPAAAAPMWVERQAAPKASLLDPTLRARDEASARRVDHSAFNGFLAQYVEIGPDGVSRVGYAAAGESGAAALAAYIASLETVEVATLSADEQLAFWINLYNAATVRLILENPSVASIRDIDKPWDTPVATAVGRRLTLNDIEHRILRPIFKDPRIHYAVNCASIGCPNLAREAYSGETIDAALDKAASAYVNHPRGVEIEDGKVTASKIYGWYRDDFGRDDRAVLDHIRLHAAPALAEMLDGKTRIDAYRYDWRLNAATP